MNDAIGMVLVAMIIVMAVVTGNFLVNDFRLFQTIVKECNSTGYIQDNRTRVMCSVEKPAEKK